MANQLKISIVFVLSIFCFSCKSKIKQHNDSLYSRHLQRHVSLTVITTPLPSKKENMNLLLFNDNSLLETINAKKIIDSLFQKKLIQPLIIVGFDGKEENYGFITKDKVAAKKIDKYNKYIDDELLPFIKKKTGIAEFNNVAICGLMSASKNALEVAFNDDTQFQKVGMFSPQFNEEDFILINTLSKITNKKIYIEDNGFDSSAKKIAQIITSKNSNTACKIMPSIAEDIALKKIPTIKNFAGFLLWAFSK